MADPGLQNERTALAWQRTILALVAVTLLTARLLALHRHWVLPAGLAIGAVLGGLLAAAWVRGVYQTRRRRWPSLGRGLAGTDGRALVVATGLLILAGVGAGWYLVVVL